MTLKHKAWEIAYRIYKLILISVTKIAFGRTRKKKLIAEIGKLQYAAVDMPP